VKTSDVLLAVGGGLAGAFVISRVLGGSGGSGTLFVIPLENHGARQVVGNGSMPYFNQLVQSYAYCSNYRSNLHPSLPNYLVMTSGQNFGVLDDNYHRIPGTDNVFAEMSAAGVPWRAYAESIPGPCSTHDTELYASRHNPAVYYDAVVGSGSCSSNVISWDDGQTELATVMPKFVWLTPNIIDDMHDGTPAQCDAWLSSTIPYLMGLSGFTNGGAIVITFDEVEGGPDSLATVVIAPGMQPKQDGTAYDHRSLCAMIQDWTGVPRLPATEGVTSLMGALR
jgi:phosphatidylinositol-3-phosphatase